MNHILASQAKPSQAKPSQAKPSQAKPSQAKPSQFTNLKFRPLLAALLAVFPLLNASHSLAADPSDPIPGNAELPDLGVARTQNSSLAVRPGPGGITVEGSFDQQKLIIAPEYSNETGLSLGVALASMLGQDAAVGVLLNIGNEKKEWLINAGYKLDERQRFVVTAGQLKQFLDYAFLSGTENVGLTQNSGALSYQLQLGTEFLRFLEVNGYLAKTDGRDLTDKTFAVDTATLFELWNDPRRIAGGEVTGLQAKLGFSPLEGSLIKVSLGDERLRYDYYTGKDSTNRLTGGVEWLQQLPNRFNLKLSADTFASQNRYSIGLDRSIASSERGRHILGVSLDSIRGRDGLGNDTQFKLIYSYVFGTGFSAASHARLTASPDAPTLTPSKAFNGVLGSSSSQSALWSGSSLLDQVALRPSVIPGHIVAKIDTTALPTRLIAVDKTALPAGTTINAATGDITTPLGVIVTGIASVTRNGGAFANNGQFALSGNSTLITRPNLIVQPPAGVIDTYVVTFNNQGGGTTLATVIVSHGSVKIDRISITAGESADGAAPVTTAPLGVSGTTHLSTTLSVTINENGTGYYLVQPAANPAPTVAAVLAGTAFAMSANTAATPAIGGLAAATGYTVYFVAKDTANNVQAVVQSVALTTTAAPDITPPVTTAAPSISIAATDTSATVTQTINESGTGYYLMLPAASAAPTVAAVLAGTPFAMTAGVAVPVSLTGLTANTPYKYYFVAKDAAATPNVQAAVSAGLAITTTAAADTAPPVTTVAPNISIAATDTTATVTQTINESGTGYYLMLPAASAAPTVAAVLAGTPFAMTAGVAAPVSLTGLTASTAYKYYFVAKDAAAIPNVQAAVSTGLAITTTAAADTAPPVTTVAPNISIAATATTATVTQTINESGTGYYLMLPAANPAPTVAAVLAGTPFAMTAGVATPVSLTGLTANTPYKYYFVAKDAAATPNVQATVSTGLAITTTAAADTTPPVTTAAPSISVAATDTTATVTQTINESGTGYYLMLPAASAAPTVAAVLAGTPFAMTAGVAAPVSLTGLTANTPYKYYFVAKDAAATPNVQAAVSAGLAITTTVVVADTIPPVTTIAPSISVAATATTASVTQTINENGTGYYLVQLAAAAAPDVAAVMAGTPFAMTGGAVATASLTGLSASTAYKYYFVAKDAANNPQAAVSAGLAITTTAAPDITPPVTSVAPAISVAATDTTASVTQTINENGTGYYLVQLATAAAPDVAAVMAGTPFAMTGGAVATVSLTGLTASTAYKYYFVAKDAANNPQAAVSAGLAITTTAAPDITPPVTSVAPAISVAATDTTASVTQTINENGTGYYLVQLAAAAAPDVAAVMAGTPFAMTGGSVATVSLTGLTASTAYKYYFVAKDAANNPQAAVSAGLAITTTAAPDITPPVTSVAPAISVAATATTASVTQTINENGTGYYLVQLAAAAAPDVAAVMAGTPFAMTGGAVATVSLTGLTASTAYKYYFVAKDAANNPQVAVSTGLAITTSAGYVSQGGLTWTPNTISGGSTNWNTANAYCTTATINGYSGWRLPTVNELSGLKWSGALNGQGWALDYTWSSEFGMNGGHLGINLASGNGWDADDTENFYVSCVR